MGRSEWRERGNRLETLLAHMLKRAHQAEKRTRSWDSTVDEQRRALERLFAPSASLKRDLQQTVEAMYPYARRKAAHETRLGRDRFPERLPWTVDGVLREER